MENSTNLIPSWQIGSYLALHWVLNRLDDADDLKDLCHRVTKKYGEEVADSVLRKLEEIDKSLYVEQREIKRAYKLNFDL